MSDLAASFDHVDFTTSPAIVAAISGGSDSTALLLLLRQHLDRIGSQAALTAVTIDHGLRAESAAEARSASAFAARLGVAHRTIAWHGDKPATGLAAAARTARYRLLATEAARLGADIIVTGHTADDQAETVSMRATRGAGRGMAGMAPATLHCGTAWIVRPLLAARRETLRALLRDHGVTWLEDPSNSNTASERVRTRAALGRSDDVEALLEMARRAGAARSDLGQRAAVLIGATATMATPGLVHLAPDFPQARDRDAAVYTLRILLAAMGGTMQLPDEERTSHLLDRLVAGLCRATLSRTVVEHGPRGTLLRRERRDLPAPRPALDGAVWDGRFRLLRQAGAGDATVGLGGAETAAAEDFAAAWPSMRLIRAAHATLPRLIPPASGHGAPGWRAEPVLAPWSCFLPSFDLQPARALAALLGAPAPPAPPLSTAKSFSA